MTKFEETTKPASSKHPELLFFFILLCLDWITKPANAKAFNTEAQQHFVSLVVNEVNTESNNRRTLDAFAAKLYAYFARIYGDHEQMRNDFLAIYRT